jgi:hypothetical protein
MTGISTFDNIMRNHHEKSNGFEIPYIDTNPKALENPPLFLMVWAWSRPVKQVLFRGWRWFSG